VIGGIVLGGRVLRPGTKVLGVRVTRRGGAGVVGPIVKELSRAGSQIGHAGAQLGRVADEVGKAREQAQKVGKVLG
jgi:hypothetical protein